MLRGGDGSRREFEKQLRRFNAGQLQVEKAALTDLQSFD